MNKQQILKKCKKFFYYYNIDIYNNCITFEIFTKEGFNNCYIELEYKNQNEKREIYNLLNDFINCFDFSFKTEFYNKKELENFINC